MHPPDQPRAALCAALRAGGELLGGGASGTPSPAEPRGARGGLAHGPFLRAREVPQAQPGGPLRAGQELSRSGSALLVRRVVAATRGVVRDLRGFRADAAPAGAPERCSDGCPLQAECPYDAERFYLGPDEKLAAIWPWCDVSGEPSRESRRHGLETGPYGRCVYRCDNDVADHQVVSGALTSGEGLTGSFGVHGHASRESRSLRIVGSEGELRGVLDEGWLEWSRPGAFEAQRFRFDTSPLGHFGGDRELFEHFCRAVALGAPEAVLASGRSALESHLLGFAAERARERGEVVDLAEYRAEVESLPDAGRNEIAEIRGNGSFRYAEARAGSRRSETTRRAPARARDNRRPGPNAVPRPDRTALRRMHRRHRGCNAWDRRSPRASAPGGRARSRPSPGRVRARRRGIRPRSRPGPVHRAVRATDPRSMARRVRRGRAASGCGRPRSA